MNIKGRGVYKVTIMQAGCPSMSFQISLVDSQLFKNKKRERKKMYKAQNLPRGKQFLLSKTIIFFYKI